ncbi:MAG: chromate transporter [Coriobacteriaceae bacterium]|nr:chromate transporter [Coriobacteriaceae bacterium]
MRNRDETYDKGGKVSLPRIFFTFVKVSLMTYTGYAIMPIIQREIIDKRGWVTQEEALDYYAIGQSTPGIVATNMSTFVGHACRGTLGGIVATLGFALPSVITVGIIATLIGLIIDIEAVQHAFAGIRVAVIALIVKAVIGMWPVAIKDAVGIIVFACALLLSLFLPAEPVLIILAAAIFGLLYQGIRRAHANGAARQQGGDA